MKRLFYFIFLSFFVYPACAQEPKLMLPIGHTKSINSIIFSKDGNTVVTASQDNTVKLWDAKTGALIAVYKDSVGQITNASFSPGEKYILISGQNPVVKLWDPGKDVIRLELKGHHSKVFTASFSRDGKKILSASFDSTSKIWNATTGSLQLTLKGHTGGVFCAAFSSDNQSALTGSLDSTVKLWHAANGKLLTTIKLPEKIKAAEFSADGKQIIITGWTTGNVYVRNINGSSVPAQEGVKAISPDQTKYFATDNKGGNALWDAAKQNMLFKLEGITDEILSAKFSSDSKLILITTWSKARTWDVATGKLLATVPGTFMLGTTVLSPGGKNIIVGDFYGAINSFNSGDGKLIKSFKGYSHPIEAASFSPDQKLFVTTSTSTKVWDAEKISLLMDLKGQSEGLHSAVFSPDGKKILTGAFGGVEVWDVSTGGRTLFIPTALDPLKLVSVYSAQFSPDGKLIGAGLADSTVRIWDAVSGALIKTFKGHSSTVYSVAFSPDGNNIASVSFDNSLKVWEVSSGNLLWDAHSNDLYSVTYNKDGKKILTASWNKVELRDAYSGKLIKEYKDPANNAFRCAVFNSSDKIIVTSSFNGVAVAWDAESGRKIKQFNGHRNSVTSVALTDNGERLLTSSADNTIKIWDTNTGETLYSLLPLENKDYLVVDNYNRYDGSEAARKMLYFTCGTEIIELDQVKDQLWVPSLAERIMKHEPVNGKKLSELNICGLTPLVKASENSTGYQYKITPRKGGLGETILYVNGIEAKRYVKQQLVKTASGYDLSIKRSQVQNFFAGDKQNTVTVKAYTAANDISSRGAQLIEDEPNKILSPPNLFAVFVGVSDYKGEGLDLKYAAKDANDIGNAIKFAAAKLLNSDGSEHVFVYSLTTNKEHYLLPEKNSIKTVLAEIKINLEDVWIYTKFF